MKNLIYSLLFIVILVIFSSCTTSSPTNLTGSWKSPELAGSAKKFNKIIVFAVVDDLSKRKAAENAVTLELLRKKINAVSSLTFFQPGYFDADGDGKLDDDKTKEVIQEKLKSLGVDGVIIITVKDIKEEEHYVPGQVVSYSPHPNYYGYYGYYSSSYNTVYYPGYYETSKEIFLVSNFYDVESGKLLWSAQTETSDPKSLDGFVKSLSQTLVDKLIADKIIKP
jgi:hypothetical protein